MNTPADQTFRQALGRYRAGDRERAAGLCRQALASDEDHGEAARLLATILAESGRAGEGIRLLERLASGPDPDARVCYSLGRMLAQTGAYDAAVAPLERAREADPANPEIARVLGFCLVRLGRADEAARVHEAVLGYGPVDPALLRGYGEILTRLARFDEAIAAYRRALKMDPDDATAPERLAGLYERTNRLEDMASIVQEGLRRFPDDPRLRFQRAVHLRRRDDPEAALAILEELQREQQGTDLGRRVAFEAGRLLDRMGNHDRAFEQARLGNRLAAAHARRAAGDAEAYGDWLDRIARDLSAPGDSADTVPPQPPDPDAPVFILGFPRSGTTLIDVLLATRNEYQVYEEKPFVAELFGELARHGQSFPECGPRLDAGLIDELRRRYFQAARRFAERRPGTVVVDKNPLATPVVPLLHQIFPRAKYVFAVRHPLDVCLSCYLYSFSPNSALAECETVEQVADAYAKTMNIWRLARRHLPLDALEVCYEAMVEDFPAESRRLFDFLGLPWDESVLEFAQRARQGAPTLRNYDRVIQGIYRTSRYRWRNYERHLADAAAIVREAAEHFGYRV